MDELFQRLEKRIRTLVERCEQLERENSELREARSSLTHEKNTLTANNRQAVLQIENMISRLQSIEITT